MQGAFRILVISDTHSWPLNEWTHADPLPDADVLIHTGDMTEHSTPHEFEGIMRIILAHPAKYKYIIAGNHDGALDPPFWRKAVRRKYRPCIVDGINDHDPEGFIRAAHAAVHQPGVTYLTHGIHQIEIAPGRYLKVFASPITTWFHDYAFSYRPEIDPDPFAGIDDPDVDMFILHGPPGRGYNDHTPANILIGDNNIWAAVRRCKPSLIVHGHNHPPLEDVTAVRHFWPIEYGQVARNVSLGRKHTLDIASTGRHARKGRETLIANAAISSARTRPEDYPTLIYWDPASEHTHKKQLKQPLSWKHFKKQWNDAWFGESQKRA